MTRAQYQRIRATFARFERIRAGMPEGESLAVLRVRYADGLRRAEEAVQAFRDSLTRPATEGQ